MASHSSRSSLKTFMDKQNLRSKGSLLVFLLCALPAACASSSNQPRPLFVFGHMANSLNELDSYMEQGVNAIEADFTFASNGTALKLYHGPSNCFCGLDCEQSTEVSAYLTYLRDSVSEGGKYADKLLLFYADTKTDDLSGDNVYQAGVSLANNLMQNLWMNVPFEHMLNVIVSIFNLKAKDLLKGALDTFSQAENSSLYLDHVGFDVSGYNFLDDIASTYKELGIDRHRWQGDGTINCLMKIYPSLRMSFVTERRTAENSTRNYVDKAYVWTVDDTGTIRRYLRNDVDGFVTNKPGNVFKVLAEDPFSSSYRLATSDDNPWQRIP
ncbi:dermonecrotic toxin SPH-like isoform X2 [Amblyomma americanum]